MKSAAIVLLIIIILAFGGYILINKSGVDDSGDTAPMPVPEAMTPSETGNDAVTWKTYSKPKSRFDDTIYSFKYPSTWVLDDSKAIPTDEYVGSLVSLTKKDYEFGIYIPSAYGGTICEFKDNPNLPTVGGMSPMKFPGDYVEIISPSDTFRRSVTPHFVEEKNTNTWFICKKEKNSNSFVRALVGYQAPINFDYKIILEMDEILKTSVGLL